MRLLPRTERGTWLLAGVVWLAACGAFWWFLPPLPRWKLPAPNWFLGFLPDKRTGILVADDSAGGFRGPIQVWDVPTGRFLTSYFGSDDMFRYAYLAAGDRLVLVSKPEPTSTGQSYHVRVVDAASGAEVAGSTFHTSQSNFWGPQ